VVEGMKEGVAAGGQAHRVPGAGAVVERCADVSSESLELVDERGGVGAGLPGCDADGRAGHGFPEAVKPLPAVQAALDGAAVLSGMSSLRGG
jgi:hypothetical protein